nr:axin-2 [Meriones unguiculatus]
MSSAVLVTLLPDPSSSFREDAPRPPVPGEEGETPPCQPSVGKGQSTKPMPVSSNARRNEDGLGEPEGRASPDSPLTRWTKSLHSLLGDQDGAYLFRTFLEREKCVDTLDFWFACNGFRQMNLKDTKTLRVAKAIYKRYIENNSIVSKQLKPATKTYIRDGIKKQQIDSVMFDQAQTEIQAVMEENAYQVFLTSDIYLEYVRSGGENTAYMSSGGLGSLKVLCGYLPTLNEEEEWTCADLKCKLSPTVVGLSSKTLRATASVRSTETVENGFRSFKRSDPVNPYHVGSGYVFAPATSANDSEISSDALTDDSLSMTDSSVDGIPPYRMGSKKQLQREMHRSVKANGQVALPHFPRQGFCLVASVSSPGTAPVMGRCSLNTEQKRGGSLLGGCVAAIVTRGLGQAQAASQEEPDLQPTQCICLVRLARWAALISLVWPVVQGPPVGTDAPLASLLARRRHLNKLSHLPLRYYFKKASDEFACGAVFEEVWDDETVLPMYEGRILGKVERID